MPLEQIENIFRPLIGEVAWSVRRGIESFLTLEFGEPHRRIREPIALREVTDPALLRNFQRRRVTLSGHWHLWVQCCEWRISTASGAATDRDLEAEILAECLADLDGQKLVSAAPGDAPWSTVLRFDLGGMLQIAPWGEARPDDDQWSLFIKGGAVVSLLNDGSFHRERADPT